MKNKSLDKVVKYVATNKVALGYVAGGIVVLIVAVPLIKKISSLFSGKYIKGLSDTFDDIKIDESKTTISDVEATQFANALVTAMSVSSGTDEDTIENIIDRLNPEDYRKLYKTFRKRTYSSFNSGSPTGGILNNAVDTTIGADDLELHGWFKQELGFGDWGLIAKIKKLSEQAGIPYV